MDSVLWYCVSVQEPTRVLVQNVSSASFIMDYTQQIYFANGALCDVAHEAPNPNPGTGVVLVLLQPCVDEAHFQGEFAMYCTSPLWIEAVSKGLPITPPLQTEPSYTFDSSRYEGYVSEGSGCFNWAGDSSDPAVFWGRTKIQNNAPCRILYMLFVAGILIALFYANLAICTAIGATATKWSYVFAWLFTGNIVYCILCGGLIPLALGTMCLRNGIFVGIGGCIIMFVFTCSFGAPMAWFEGHQKALNAYLEPSKLKTLNCWRNPTDHFDQIAHHFIVFEEPDWYVDYRTRDTQKSQFIVEEDNEGNAKSGRYNYCVAPIKYRGAPYCPQDFYAACFRKTDTYALLSCSDADANTCGWQYNSANNILRTLNRNEEFYSDIAEEDETKWRAAFNLAPRLFTSPASSILGFYSGAGPQDIADMAGEKEAMRDRVFVAGMVVYSFFVAVLALISGICVGDD